MGSPRDILPLVDKAISQAGSLLKGSWSSQSLADAYNQAAASFDATVSLLSQAQDTSFIGSIVGGALTDVYYFLTGNAVSSKQAAVQAQIEKLRDDANLVLHPDQDWFPPDNPASYANSEIISALYVQRDALSFLGNLDDQALTKLASVAGAAVDLVIATLQKLINLLGFTTTLVTWALYVGVAAAVVVGGYVVYKVAKPATHKLIARGQERFA